MDKDKNVEGYRQNLAYYKDLKNNISWEFLNITSLNYRVLMIDTDELLNVEGDDVPQRRLQQAVLKLKM
ncbi:unnamed protein product [Brassica oleracea]|uniref:(rape) hypothetical protein n=1 Tax=Brassica napus TaxID=3708 RepID=A0A816JXD2_BRANA|nr:unnamed protein product [Brassica napus]